MQEIEPKSVIEASQSRSDRLAAIIRQRIVSGEFSPGKRLPTFQDMESMYSTSRKVVQLAVSRLKDDGFLRPQTERGLFVADHPPHLKRYGVVFPVGYGSPEWSRFDDVLVKEAMEVEKQSIIREFDIFTNTSGYSDGPGVLERLKDECRRDRLAGLILMPGTHELVDHFPFDSELLPKVFVFRAESYPYRPVVSVNGEAMVARGLEWLAQRGRKRVAILRVSDYGSNWDWAGFYDQAGLAFRPQWVQAVGRYDPSVVQSLIPLLLDYPEEEKPDGLFVIDENLSNYAATALAGQGVRLGEEFDIVAHCNWPQPEPKMLPMRRIGFHAGHLLDYCLQAIDAQRRGETPPEIQRLSPFFEDEIELTRVGECLNIVVENSSSFSSPNG